MKSGEQPSTKPPSAKQAPVAIEHEQAATEPQTAAAVAMKRKFAEDSHGMTASCTGE